MPRHNPYDSESYIYVLRDRRTGDVRYVGITNNPTARLKQHLSAPTNPGMAQWLIEAGGHDGVEIMVVDTIPAGEDWETVEWDWIDRLSQEHSLLNQTRRGHRIQGAGGRVGRSSNNDNQPGRAAAVRRSYRLAPDVIQRIEEIARAESTTATAVIEAAVRAYRGGVEARVAALESWRESIEGRPVDGDSSTGQAGAIPPPRL